MYKISRSSHWDEIRPLEDHIRYVFSWLVVTIRQSACFFFVFYHRNWRIIYYFFHQFCILYCNCQILIFLTLNIILILLNLNRWTTDKVTLRSVDSPRATRAAEDTPRPDTECDRRPGDQLGLRFHRRETSCWGKGVKFYITNDSS